MSGPPVITCPTCAGLTFKLEPCQCRDGGNRLLVEWDDVADTAFRDCQLCRGTGTLAVGCFDCGQRGRRRAQLVLTVANLDTGVVASRNVVPGSLTPTRGPDGGWCLALAPLRDELTREVGAAGLVDRRRPWEEADLVLALGRSWRPDLPAGRRDELEAQAIVRGDTQPWRLYLGRTHLPPAETAAQTLGRFCGLAELLCLDLVIEARRDDFFGATWHVRFEVPGGDVPEETRGCATDLPAALARTTVADALAWLGERGLHAPAYTVAPRPVDRPPPPAADPDRLARRVRADLDRAPAAQAIWRDGRWWHTRLVPGGTTVVLHGRATGQVSRRPTTVLRRAGEPPAPSWQGTPIGYVDCTDCAPGSRLQRCDCVADGQVAAPGCARCVGAGFAPSVFPCDTCRGSRRLHRGLTVTVTDLHRRARHDTWLPRPGEPTTPLERRLHQLPGRYRLADQATDFGVRPDDLTEADGGQPLDVMLRDGVGMAPPEVDPVRHFVTRTAAGRPGARLIVVARTPDVPSLTELFRLALGLRLAVAVTVRCDRYEATDPPGWRGWQWGIQLLPPGTPADRIDPPVRPTVEAAIAFCLDHLDNAITEAAPVEVAQPIPVPHSPALPGPTVDPLPLIRKLAVHHPGEQVVVHLDGGCCQLHLGDPTARRLLARAHHLRDAVRALDLPPP
ncbi:hypothetical protein ACLQ24_14830 [Micromonospora sp. DT4]|uniref:hypothetical protein n=1 Tax=Micromonospora sp. DT4 TaxID=3393438 RepID=UPI003CEB3175